MDETYPDGPVPLIERWEKRRARLTFGEGEALPPLDTDLSALVALQVSTPPPLRHPSAHAVKKAALMTEFAGQSELALLNALLIAHLRKRRYPKHAPGLFHRLWVEQGAVLLPMLAPRWQISSVITFATHGRNEQERRIGAALNMLFSLMKLYEFERLYSGLAPTAPFPRKTRKKAALPLDMPEFSLDSGGLDINLLAPIWNDARKDAVVGPLACHLLDQLNRDPGTLFRRLALMRQRRTGA